MTMASGVFAGPAFGAAAGVLFGLLLATVCVSDLRTRRIPNRLVLAIAATGLLYSAAAQPVIPGLLSALAGIGVGLALWFPFFALGMLGAGDVKFFAAACAWIGAGLGWRASVLAALLGGVLAVLWVLVGAGIRRGAIAVAADIRSPRLGMSSAVVSGEHAKKLPYGVAMAIAVAIAAWFPHLLR